MGIKKVPLPIFCILTVVRQYIFGCVKIGGIIQLYEHGCTFWTKYIKLGHGTEFSMKNRICYCSEHTYWSCFQGVNVSIPHPSQLFVLNVSRCSFTKERKIPTKIFLTWYAILSYRYTSINSWLPNPRLYCRKNWLVSFGYWNFRRQDKLFIRLSLKRRRVEKNRCTCSFSEMAS